MKTHATVTLSEVEDAEHEARAVRLHIVGLSDDPGRLTAEQWQRHKRDLERRAKEAEETALRLRSEYERPATVLVPVRVQLEIAEKLALLARRIGVRRATWAAQALSLLSECHPDDWYSAIAAFQAAQKRRAS